MNLEGIYSAHPVRRETIYARLERQRIRLTDLTEWHLALDPEGELTDQNHSGGVQSVLELGVAANVSKTTRLVDVGAGIGGPARVLAQSFGCQVVAIDQDSGRCADAVDLTRLVHLDDLVTVVHGDALAIDTPPDPIDVLWGQDAWIHFADLGLFLDRWVPRLSDKGRVIVADAHLRRDPRTPEEEGLLTRLAQSWGAVLRPLDGWTSPLTERGFRITLIDRTREAIESLDRLARASSTWPAGVATEAERESWRLAIAGYQQGLVGSFRLIASRAQQTGD
jgi:predicted O-methyltransferase YrrM